MEFKTIVFDLGNVLLPFDYTPFIQKLNGIKPGLGERLITTYRNNYNIHRSFESGDFTEDEFLNLMIEWTEGAVSKELFCVIFSDIFKENVELTRILPLLKRKYQLVLLSNTNSIHKKFGWDKYEFIKHFDYLCLSHEVRAVKPEEKIYKAVEAYTGHSPNEHIFIDDIQEYADGAKKAGWDALRYTCVESLLNDFKMKGIL